MLLRFNRAIKAQIILMNVSMFLWSKEASLTGIILSKNNLTPIHGANIYIEQLGVGTASQVDGSFIIDNLPYDKVSLTISMIGFKDVDTSLDLERDANDIGEILMIRDTIKIDEVNVDAHSELEPKSFSSNIYITGSQYHSNLKSSLALTIEEETGVAIRSMGQGTTQPVLRGYSGDRFLLTEDGLTAGDLSNTSIDHTVSIDMASFNKVRVIRGPETLLYGSNTIGGVINVSRQIDADTRFNKSSLQAVFGTESSSSSIFGNIVYYQPINDKNQLRLSLLKRNSGDQMSPIGVVANTALTNNEVTGSYTYFGSDYRTTFSLEQIAMNYGIPGSPEGHISGVDIEMKKNTQKFNFHRDISFFGFQTLDIDQRYTSYGHTELEKGISNPSVILDQQIFSLKSIFKGPQSYLGSLLQHRDFQAGGFYWTPDTKELNIAVFGLVERKVFDFTLQFSSRIEYLSVMPDIQYSPSNIDSIQIVQRDFPILSSGIGIFQNWQNWDFSFSTMLTGRSPGIEDLYSDGPHLGTYAYEIGQPTLGQEKTIGLEASLEHHTNKREIRFTGYHNFSPNYHISTKIGDCPESINWNPTLGISHPCAGSEFIEWGSGSGWLYKYQMEGVRASVYGLESELEYKLTNSINLYGSISILRGNNNSKGVPLAYMPPDKYLFSTELDLKPASATITLKKVSPQKRLGEFETKTNGYLLADVSGTYIIHSSNVIHKFIFRVDNIFDKEYYNHLSRIKMIMPEKGRSVGIQYRVVF